MNILNNNSMYSRIRIYSRLTTDVSKSHNGGDYSIWVDYYLIPSQAVYLPKCGDSSDFSTCPVCGANFCNVHKEDEVADPISIEEMEELFKNAIEASKRIEADRSATVLVHANIDPEKIEMGCYIAPVEELWEISLRYWKSGYNK